MVYIFSLSHTPEFENHLIPPHHPDSSTLLSLRVAKSAAFKNVSLHIARAFWSFLSFATANTQLPSTFELLALYANNRSLVGCVLSSGNFTTNLQACYPFRAFPVSADLSNVYENGSPCSVDRALVCPTIDGVADNFTVSVIPYQSNSILSTKINEQDNSGFLQPLGTAERGFQFKY
jgi:hypothetical protein